MYKAKCVKCNRVFKDGDEVLQIHEYVTNERHGDFVSAPVHGRYIHAHHVIRGT